MKISIGRRVIAKFRKDLNTHNKSTIDCLTEVVKTLKESSKLARLQVYTILKISKRQNIHTVLLLIIIGLLIIMILK